MRKGWGLLSGMVLLLACGVPASTSVVRTGGEYAELYQRILWMDKESKEPMFIPEQLFAAHSLDELPLERNEKERIRLLIEEHPRRIAEQRKNFPDRQISLCLPSPWEWDEAGSNPPLDFGNLIAKNEMTILGQVVAVVPGWSVWGSRANRVAYVKIQEVLRDNKREFRPGQIVAFREQHGALEIRGQKVCTDAPPGYYSAEKGDDVLVSGDRWQTDPFLFYGEVFVPVKDGFASSQGYTPIEKTRPIALDELRGVAKALEKKKP